MKLNHDEIRSKANMFARTIFWRNAREWAAAILVVGGFGWRALAPETPALVRLGSLLTVAGALYVSWRLARDGRALPPPPAEASTADHLAAHRANLERQRGLLLSVPRWYIAPLVPG